MYSIREHWESVDKPFKIAEPRACCRAVTGKPHTAPFVMPLVIRELMEQLSIRQALLMSSVHLTAAHPGVRTD